MAYTVSISPLVLSLCGKIMFLRFYSFTSSSTTVVLLVHHGSTRKVRHTTPCNRTLEVVLVSDTNKVTEFRVDLSVPQWTRRRENNLIDPHQKVNSSWVRITIIDNK